MADVPMAILEGNDLENERYILRMKEKKHENVDDTLEMPDEPLTPYSGLLHKRDISVSCLTHYSKSFTIVCS